MKTFTRNFSLLVLVSFLCIEIFSQNNKIISSVSSNDAKEGNPLKVEVELYQGTDISRVLFVYKIFGNNEFTVKEMNFTGRKATISIPGTEILPPTLEYYIKVETTTGESETYPVGVPESGTPTQLQVMSFSQKDREILILSPAPGSMVSQDELFISISFLNAPASVKREATKIFINDIDMSDKSVISGDLLVLYPGNFDEKINSGSQNVKIKAYTESGELYHELSFDFVAATQAEYVAEVQKLSYNFNLIAESKNEKNANISTWYNNLNANLQASYKSLDFGANVYVTSEEKKFKQPNNRYSAYIKSDWFNIAAGDNNPVFPSLIMDGKRVRGISGALNLGFFNVQATYGETERNIEGELLQKLTKDEAYLSSNIIALDELKYGKPFARINPGTFKRNVFAVRPSFGAGENFQLGFSYLHSKDDVNSIEFGTLPAENLVVGSDLMFAFDDRNFQFFSQAAVSIKNSDISTGDITDAQIDSLFMTGDKFDSDPQSIKDAKKILSKFITVNQFLGPLNPQELSSLAAEAGIRLNYINNNLSLKYVYRGNEFVSFGQPFTRTDVKGINISDRIRMLDNKLFLNIGYEKLEDNLQKTKQATTTYQIFNTSISIFPRADFPNITIGLASYNTSNDLMNNSDPSLAANAVDDLTSRFYTTISYDIKSKVKHRAQVNLSFSNRDDKTIGNSDSKTTSASFFWNSFWDKRLNSFVSLTVYTSEIALSKFDYQTLSVGGRYQLIPDLLTLEASLSPSFGDFKRQAFDLTGIYYIYQNLSLEGQLRIYRIPDAYTDTIIGARLRYNL